MTFRNHALCVKQNILSKKLVGQKGKLQWVTDLKLVNNCKNIQYKNFYNNDSTTSLNTTKKPTK